VASWATAAEEEATGGVLRAAHQVEMAEAKVMVARKAAVAMGDAAVERDTRVAWVASLAKDEEEVGLEDKMAAIMAAAVMAAVTMAAAAIMAVAVMAAVSMAVAAMAAAAMAVAAMVPARRAEAMAAMAAVAMVAAAIMAAATTAAMAMVVAAMVPVGRAEAMVGILAMALERVKEILVVVGVTVG